MNYNEFLKSADALLFSPEFDELRQAIEFKEPNIWHILGISRKETAVSSFLAWLLDPQAGHSLGDSFLKELLIYVLRKESRQNQGLTPVHVKLRDFSTINVTTETYLNHRRCDILIASPVEKEAASKIPGFLCVIENKVGAKESFDQTKDYFEASFAHYPVDQYPYRVYIFLSPAGDAPQCEEFIPVTYQDLLNVLDQVKTTQRLEGVESFLINQFQENITRGISMDKKVIDLAQSLYDQHAQLFEFIFQNVERRELDRVEQLERGGWDGKSWFFNVGEMPNSGYRWEDCLKYSFLVAGGGPRYRKVMERYKVGDILYAYVNGKGYVGVGKVTHKAIPFLEARLPDGSKLWEMPLAGTYAVSDKKDDTEWVVLVEWEVAVPKEKACREVFITPATTGRIYERRAEMMNKVLETLKQKA